MANFVFDIPRKRFMDGEIDMLSDDIKFTFHDDDDVAPLQATHDDLSDLSAGTVATSGNLTTKDTTAGVFDADDETVNTVSGDEFESIILFDDTHASDSLICRIDTGTGLPCTPNGGNITVQWDSGGNKIFKL
jgi:hypothetical protein